MLRRAGHTYLRVRLHNVRRAATNVSFYRPASAIFITRFDRLPAPRHSDHSFLAFRTEIERPIRTHKTNPKLHGVQSNHGTTLLTSVALMTNKANSRQSRSRMFARATGKHLEGCPNAGRPLKPTTGQEWTAEKLYEAVCLKGYYDLAQELNASIAAERKAD